MSFVKGFSKIAADPIVFSNIGKSLAAGAREAGKHTVADTLKLKGLKHLKDAVTEAGGMGKAFTTQSGREALAKGVGRAAPAIGMAGLYAAGGKKIYDKAKGQASDPYYYAP